MQVALPLMALNMWKLLMHQQTTWFLHTKTNSLPQEKQVYQQKLLLQKCKKSMPASQNGRLQSLLIHTIQNLPIRR
jgi:predicted metallo-beta-lactamase superfamily hydrolase